MIKAAAKNYFRYFRYIIAIMGMVYLGIFIAVTVFGGGFFKIFGGNIQTSYESVSDYIKVITEGANIKRIFTREFLSEFFIEIKDIINGQTPGAAGGTVAYAAVSAAVILLFCQLSKTVCRSFIKKDVSNGGTKRGIIVFVIRTMISAVSAAAFLIVSYLWIFSAFILAAVNQVFKAVTNLMYSRYIYYPKAPLKEFLRPRIVGLSVLGNLLSLLINAAFVTAVWLVFNPFIAIILALPLIMYSAVIMEFTSVEYFRKNPPAENAGKPAA